jgi:hypothetical protein
VRNNLLDGGGYPLYCAVRSPESGSIVTGNRFGPNHRAGFTTGCNEAAVTWTGNVLDATGAALAAA